MADVLNLQEEGPETPDEDKRSNPSYFACAGNNKSNKSIIFC